MSPTQCCILSVGILVGQESLWKSQTKRWGSWRKKFNSHAKGCDSWGGLLILLKVDKWLKGGDSRVPSTRSRGEEDGFSLGNYKKHTIGERVHILALNIWIICKDYCFWVHDSGFDCVDSLFGKRGLTKFVHHEIGLIRRTCLKTKHAIGLIWSSY